jgi:hypothetical protein
MTYRSVFVDGRWKTVSNESWFARIKEERRRYNFLQKILWED